MARQPDRWNTNTPARERSIRVLRSAFALDSLHSPAAAAAALAQRPELFRGACLDPDLTPDLSHKVHSKV